MKKNFPNNIVFECDAYTVSDLFVLVEEYSGQKFSKTEEETLKQYLRRKLQAGEEEGRWDRLETSTKRKTLYPKEAAVEVFYKDCYLRLREIVAKAAASRTQQAIAQERELRRNARFPFEPLAEEATEAEYTLEDYINEEVMKRKIDILLALMEEYVLEFDETTLRTDLATTYLYSGTIEDLEPAVVNSFERLKDNRSYYTRKKDFLDKFKFGT